MPGSLVTAGPVVRGDTLHLTAVRLLTALGHASVCLGFTRAAMEAFAALAQEKFRPHQLGAHLSRHYAEHRAASAGPSRLPRA